MLGADGIRPGPARDSAVGAALREIAGTELYRRNPFRIIGLSTYADRRAIRQRRQQVVPALEVGADIDLGHDLPVGADEVRAAFDRLQRDPRLRLVDELFWLWNTSDATCSCPGDLHLLHDVAVRAHSAALDREAQAADPTGKDLDDLAKLWADAGQKWRKVVRRAVFWDHVRHRIRTLDDRQLDESDIDVLRRELPTALVKPLIELAAKSGKSQGRLVKVIRDWPTAPQPVVDDLLEELAAPIYEDTRTALSEATQALDAGEPSRAAAIVDKQVMPYLRRLEAVVPHDRHRRTASVRNESAIVLNNCATALMDGEGPAADKRAQKLLTKASELTSDPHTAQRIEQNRNSLREAIKTFDSIEAEARKWVNLGRPDMAAELLLNVKRSLKDVPWADDEIDRLATRLGVSASTRPFTAPRLPSARPRRSREESRGYFVWLFKWIRFAVLAVGIPIGLAMWFGWSPFSTSAALYAERKADNAALGECVATKEGWDGDKVQVPMIGCDEPHWGEVLGYVSLGAVPSPYPGDDQVMALANFECRLLQARQGLSFGEFRINNVVPYKTAWNEGQSRYENYAPCVVSRVDNELFSGSHVADPPPKPADVAVRMDLFGARIWGNPPVGSCVKDRKLWEASPHGVDVVRCDGPHWAEIAGYPKLYDHSQKWPGDDEVYAKAEDACVKATSGMKTGAGFRISITWPAKDWWGKPDQEIYAVCLVHREDDKAFTGGLR